MRHDRKPEVHEVGRRVRERAQLVEAGKRCALQQVVDDAASGTAAACPQADGEGADFRDGFAQRRQFGAGDDFVILHADDEAVRVHLDLFELAREQVPFGKMFVDEFVDRIRVGGRADAKRDRRIADAPCARNEPRSLRTANDRSPNHLR